MVYSHEEGSQTPDPAFFRVILECLGVHPHEAVSLDDTEACVEGARRLGLGAVLFVDNYQAIAALEELLSR